MSRRSWMRVQVLAACCAAIACEAWAQTSPRPTSPLAGTSWRLISFQGAGEKPVIPADPVAYTLEFQADGRLRARIDCNGGRGRWASPAPGRIEFGPLGLTRVECKPGSLHDRIVKDWPAIDSYAVKENQLFLSVRGGTGTYQFSPLPPKEPVTRTVASEGPFAFQCAPPAGGALQATFYQTEPPMVLVEREGRTRPAFAVPSASGAKYNGKDLEFWETRGEASVVWSGVTLTCRRR